MFPDNLKIAKVCPIFKAGEKADVSNYRPISILPSFSKIFEKIIYFRLISFINKHNILSSSQFGFRKNHSTFMPLLKLHDKVTDALEKNNYCVGIFIDLSKAFDTIKHDILLKKLEYYGIRGLPLNLIQNYLANRRQYVSYRNTVSDAETIRYGVPQGSILGPLLFLLYINDLPKISNILSFLIFADDTTIIYSNPNLIDLIDKLNSELQHLSEWFSANRLSLNTSKTNFISFGSRWNQNDKTIDQSDQNIIINNEIISRVYYAKFLGVLIDSKLTWYNHINYISLKISRSLHVMNRIKHLVPKKTLLTLYYSLIYPHLNYCVIIWGSACKNALNRIKVLQKRAIRILDKNHWLAHTDSIFKHFQIIKLEDIYSLSCLIFMYKLKHNLLPDSCNNLATIRTANLTISRHYDLRSEQEFVVPKHRTMAREKCIKIRGPKLWKKLPDEVKKQPTLPSYKKSLKQHFIKSYTDTL